MELFEIPNLLSAAAILVSVILFLIERANVKKVETIKELNDIYDLYYDLKGKDINKDYTEYVRYMSKVERFAIAVNEKVYNKNVVKRQASIFFKAQYDSFMKDLIAQRRSLVKRDSYYSNIEKLIESFS